MADAVDLLTEDDGLVLVQVAKASLEQFVRRGAVAQLNLAHLSLGVQKPGGTFVTLRAQGRLRGCIGNVVAERPLAESVVRNTVAAASRDPRFPPINGRELAHVRVEVTVLTPLNPLLYQNYNDLLRNLRPGVDGVMVKWEGRRGLLLPQVWERVRETADFLNALAQKAGIPSAKLQANPPEAEIFTFQAQHFVEAE